MLLKKGIINSKLIRRKSNYSLQYYPRVAALDMQDVLYIGRWQKTAGPPLWLLYLPKSRFLDVLQ